jgi:hypothetical protein
VREWTFTLPSELPFWELESQWTPKPSESDCRGRNPSVRKVCYIIEKILKRKCLKWACRTHLDLWNISYGQKKGQESNWQFESQPLKMGNRPNFLACRWRVTYHWKSFNKCYNFSLDLIAIGGLHRKLWAPKVMGVPTLGISGLPFGSLGTKCHLNVALVERHKVTIKGKVVVSPKSGLWWVLWIRVCLWLILAPKVPKLRTNQLVVWFVHICVSD